MEKVGCCLQEAVGREASMATQLEELELHMQAKRCCRTCLMIASFDYCYYGSNYQQCSAFKK